MAEGVDTSSYPKNTLPVTKSLVDKVQGFQAMESNALSIDKQKLDLVNTQYGHLIREMNSLGPDPEPDAIVGTAQRAVKMGLIKPNMFGEFVKSIPVDRAKIPEFMQQTIGKLMTTAEAINWHYGQRENVGDGQRITPSVSSPKPGFGVRPIAPSVQQQLPVGTDVVGPGGVQRLGPQPTQVPEGMEPVPGGVSGAVQPARTGGLPVAAPQPIKPAGPMASQPPQFAAGQELLNKDLQLGTERRNQNLRLKEARSLLPGLTTGIGSEPFQKALALAKNIGIVDVNANDPTVAYQQINKYLQQAINEQGRASDSDAANKAAGSPDARNQISPALVKLVEKQIVFNRIDAARGIVFKDKDLSKYPAHASKFPSVIDQKAFGIDLMEPKARAELIAEMTKKKDTPEGKKFWQSLAIADENNLFDER